MQSIDVIKYTDEEYEKFLIDPVSITLSLLLLLSFYEILLLLLLSLLFIIRLQLVM